MNDLILDAGVAASVCVAGVRTAEADYLFNKAQLSEVKLWLYTGQISEILDRVQDQLPHQANRNLSEVARQLFKEFANVCSWLAALSEDVSGLEDSDPIAIGLIQASSRLGAESLIVTDVISRLERGGPFVDIETALNRVETKIAVPFIDLGPQQDRIRPKLERNLHCVLHHGQYVMGPEIARLESRLAEYVGSDHCICVSSGTDALLIAMMSLEISPGDEVITTPFTFFATVEIITLLGAKPIYVDIDQHTYTLDPSLVEAAISDRTKAILPVSLYGQCPDMDRINEIASSYQIPIVEDAAQSFGATYKGRKSCNLGQIGCTSFFPAKPLGAYGDAGACFTQDSQLAERIREIRDHGQSGRYEHVRMGINGRMDTLQAAVLLAKLDIFDEELNSRAQIAKMYSAMLKPVEAKELVTLPNLEPHNVSSWAQYTIEVSERSRVQSSLFEKGIPTAIHYPEPVYTQLALRESVAHCPVTDRAAKRVLSLPMHPYLSIETQELVVDSLNQSLQC